VNPFPVVLSSPSGGGKTTIARRLLRKRPDVGYSVSCTTRAPRAGEVDGVDYHFLSESEFVARRDRGEFAEWATVHGRWYGTLKSAVQRVLDGGHHVIMDVDVQGAEQFAKSYPSAVLVFVLPPSMDELERRLRERGTESEDAIRRRMLAARSEVEHGARAYDYLVVNDSVDRAYEELEAIVRAERCRRGRVDLAGLGFEAPRRGS